MVVNKSNLRLLLFCSSIIAYGALSYPFPRDLGLGEVLVGTCLALSILLGGIAPILNPISHSTNGTDIVLKICFWCLLLIPSLVAVFYQWELRDIIRDVVPVFYLFLIAFWGSNHLDPRQSHMIAMVLCICGTILAIRFHIASDTDISLIGTQGFYAKDSPDFHNPYDPSVLFAAIYLALYSLNSGIKAPITSLLSVFGSIICILSLAAIVQRGPMFLFLVSLLTYGIYVRSFMISVSTLVAGVIVGIYFAEGTLGLLNLAIEKTLSVNFSEGKLREAIYVFDFISDSFTTSVFGYGWGTVYFNPIVYGNVSFTHNFLTYMLLKTGVLGLVTLFVFFGAVFVLIRRNTIPAQILFAGIPALIVAIFLQSTYKTLTFGLIIFLLALSSKRHRSDL